MNLNKINKRIFAMFLGMGKKKLIEKNNSVKVNAFEWPIQTTEQMTVNLKDTSSFVIISGSGIRNTGKTVVTGNMGISPGFSIGGFPSGRLIGHQHINDAKANKAKLDLIEVYKDAENRTCPDKVRLSGNIGGITLTPGLYFSTSSISISSDNLTFDAQGDSYAIFIIQISTTLVARVGREVILKRGAFASNIFWQVGDSATFESRSVFKGTILALNSITFRSKAKLFGRAFSINGAVVIENNSIVIQ